MTPIQELIKEFEFIKESKCKTLQEMVFFDGVLAIFEAKYLIKEKESIKNAFYNGFCLDHSSDFDENDSENYYNNLCN